MREEPSADYEIPRAVQLEQKEFAGFERLKSAIASRLPEVDLLNCGLRPEELEPVEVSDADEGFQRSPRFTAKPLKLGVLESRIQH